MTEIEFELPAEQFELMNYPNLQQGQALTLQLQTTVLAPGGDVAWYHVQKASVAPQFVRVGCGQFAFSGQVVQAQIQKSDDYESAALMVQCGEIPLRVFCAPGMDGRLPFGTWETRTLTGVSPLVGIVEDDFSVGVGKQVSVTIWSFRRLVLRPGDAQFGRWHETDELLPTPYEFDRVLITARVHRPLI
jgi:hypothetical protein